ncbi:hypothetical protein SLEP1_g47043 [Rubroshorea leprosula]|uniref:Uncharacterized protein n=1 Tax=Rubroshorea leprosula TaxID=152421 RepID=A0AAV5LPY8_9ROSI|nr:hypothetical protein SLEP1_g47043 [Rubroshorea leprosula]
MVSDFYGEALIGKFPLLRFSEKNLFTRDGNIYQLSQVWLKAI